MISTQTLELLAYLRSQDVKLSVHEGRLRYSAPEGVLTPQLRAELVQHKAEIVELLGQVNSAVLAQPPIQPIPRQEPLPLSFGQQRFWFFEQLEPNNFAYNEALAFRLTGQLNIAALEASFREIIRRHELLRTTFITIDGQPALNIQPQLDFKLALVDFTGSNKPEAELQAFIRAEHQRPFDLAAGPLLRAYLLQLQPQEYFLLVTMHHIVTDGWSTGIFIKELTALYPYFSNSSPGPYPLPDLPIQYVDFAYWQRQWLQGSILEKQAAYWEQQLGGRLPLLHLPTDHPHPPVQSFLGATYSAQLPEPLT
ncbi:MAG TPA: condensation domain-containing protein, partial [Anaerolineae bacterium]|nr:condensation domain-containing protein [Anaerolineae bacterium]